MGANAAPAAGFQSTLPMQGVTEVQHQTDYEY